jgi:hypothetical protein
MPATQTAAHTYPRQAADDRRRFLAAMRRGESSIGWGPQCLVLGRLPAADIVALCESIEARSAGPDFFSPVQFRAEIARCAKRNGSATPDLHVRLCDAIANARHEDMATVAALILAAVPE